jgi:Phosphatase
MSDREPHFLLGLQPEGSWSPAEVLALLARRCGVDPDPAHTHGKDTIDPDRTIERLEAMAARLQEAAQKRERVVVATGHPESFRPIHAAIAQALREAGCAMPVAADGWAHPDEPAYGRHRGTIAFWTVPASVDTWFSCPIRRESKKWVRHAVHIRRSTRRIR